MLAVYPKDYLLEYFTLLYWYIVWINESTLTGRWQIKILTVINRTSCWDLQLKVPTWQVGKSTITRARSPNSYRPPFPHRPDRSLSHPFCYSNYSLFSIEMFQSIFSTKFNLKQSHSTKCYCWIYRFCRFKYKFCLICFFGWKKFSFKWLDV